MCKIQFFKYIKSIVMHLFIIIVLFLNLQYEIYNISSAMMWLIWCLFTFSSFIVMFNVFTEDNYKSITNTIILIFFQPLMYILSFANYYQHSLLCNENGYINTLTISDYLYFSIVTWTTLGYGDMRPSIDSRLLASVEGYTGYIFSGLIIAGFLKLLVRLDIQYNS